MDNDNLLVQKAADLYRGLRFKMKYRGVPILSAGAGNDLGHLVLVLAAEGAANGSFFIVFGQNRFTSF